MNRNTRPVVGVWCGAFLDTSFPTRFYILNEYTLDDQNRRINVFTSRVSDVSNNSNDRRSRFTITFTTHFASRLTSLQRYNISTRLLTSTTDRQLQFCNFNRRDSKLTLQRVKQEARAFRAWAFYTLPNLTSRLNKNVKSLYKRLSLTKVNLTKVLSRKC